MSRRAVGVDIGGTKIAAGVVADDGTVIAAARRPTPGDDGGRVTDTIVETVAALEAPIEALPIGVGAAGIVDRAGRVRFAPNVPGWVDYPLQEELRARFDARVVVENDANAATWSEFRVGAARGATRGAAMLTVGTGVGGGAVEAGRLIRGAEGLAAEFGHLVIAEGGPRCQCGNRGCLEALASGTAIGRTAREARDRGDVPADSPLAALDASELTGAAVTAAARNGDAAARDVLATVGRWLGVGMATVANALDPEIIVVGGGGAQAGELLLDPARDALDERIIGRAYRRIPPVVPAELGEQAGLIGAALLALER